MQILRWGVYNPQGELVSRHLTYRGAFWTARGHSLTQSDVRYGIWLVRRVRK